VHCCLEKAKAYSGIINKSKTIQYKRSFFKIMVTETMLEHFSTMFSVYYVSQKRPCLGFNARSINVPNAIT